MKKSILMMLMTFTAWLSVMGQTATVTVDCAAGQSLNSTLSHLMKQVPTTVIVRGTCTEYVTIDGFENLTLKGQPGAALQQPATNPQSKFYVLSINGSRRITVSGLVVHSLPIFGGIGIVGAAATSYCKTYLSTVPGIPSVLQFTRKAKFGL